MNDQLKQDVIDYLTKIPLPSYFSEMAPSDREKALFQASEEILDEFPKVTLNARMVALQALYNAEGEEEGIAMMHRQGISDYIVKDVKAVLKRENLSPFVLNIIKNLPEMQDENSSGRVGWLI